MMRTSSWMDLAQSIIPLSLTSFSAPVEEIFPPAWWCGSAQDNIVSVFCQRVLYEVGKEPNPNTVFSIEYTLVTGHTTAENVSPRDVKDEHWFMVVIMVVRLLYLAKLSVIVQGYCLGEQAGL